AERGVDVIRNGWRNVQAFAAGDAAPATPVVMTGGNFVVEQGLVKSLARPGTTATGTWEGSTAEAEKRLEEVNPHRGHDVAARRADAATGHATVRGPPRGLIGGDLKGQPA